MKLKAIALKEEKKYMKLQKILAAKVIVRNVKKWLLRKNGKLARETSMRKIRMIQLWWRKYLKSKKMVLLKELLLALVKGYQIRKGLLV
mmetsp:Transcript_36327/g.35211  ORF Transcript_36327/g.35211 Transcript_36327/m.35211 type:complete len:89 (+) Transcript_36327:786-1052(+)|eukprot:CAMPEP_0170560474 /NCGR_PEP_ID=MMETSP0211-20121228/49126_1 /TAXON_ID=311385 /ORGANISM="Pseudokeronopsis sp., Strain OXSARD2" /LENGTH=88 /DNA_ID=CAMNT_0010874699 /DNA_START=729 /DNA_END=995 /DNA_ORIENTATION=+